MLVSDQNRFGHIAIAIHWLTAILVLVAFIFGPGGPEQRIYDPSRDLDRQIHETLGLSVFTLAFVRVIWRLFDARPDASTGQAWMDNAARLVQWALYALLFVLPITAISGAWLEGHPLTLLGGIKIAPLIDSSHDIGKTIAEIHGWLGDAILWVAGLHAGAALFHHFFLQDDVLKSMLPPGLHKFLPGPAAVKR